MATAGKTGAKTGEPTIEDLAAQVETLKDDIAALLRATGEYGSGRARHAAEDARERAREMRSEAEHYAQEAGRVAAENADAALDAVRRQPLTALALAAGLGFLVGLVTSGRR